MNTQCENTKLKGYHRDNAILRTVEDWGALNTEQIQCLFFPNMSYGKRKAQERLLKMHQRNKLNRYRTGESPFSYFLDEKPGMLKHLLAINWIRIWYQAIELHSWESIHSWTYEQDYKILRTDAFIGIKNNMNHKYRFAFIEMDRGTNAFDKVQKYNKLYEQEKYSDWWWVSLTDRFPVIQVVTISESRKRLIQTKIEAENSSGLEFEVKLLDDIRGEVIKKCSTG